MDLFRVPSMFHEQMLQHIGVQYCANTGSFYFEGGEVPEIKRGRGDVINKNRFYSISRVHRRDQWQWCGWWRM